jgi:hypothetical protein
MNKRDAHDLIHWNIGKGDMQDKINEILEEEYGEAEGYEEAPGADKILNWLVDMLSMDEEEE